MCQFVESREIKTRLCCQHPASLCCVFSQFASYRSLSLFHFSFSLFTFTFHFHFHFHFHFSLLLFTVHVSPILLLIHHFLSFTLGRVSLSVSQNLEEFKPYLHSSYSYSNDVFNHTNYILYEHSTITSFNRFIKITQFSSTFDGAFAQFTEAQFYQI